MLQKGVWAAAALVLVVVVAVLLGRTRLLSLGGAAAAPSLNAAAGAAVEDARPMPFVAYPIDQTAQRGAHRRLDGPARMLRQRASKRSLEHVRLQRLNFTRPDEHAACGVSADEKRKCTFREPMTRLTPSFYVAGVAKSGTTTLHSYLLQHPNVLMAGMQICHDRLLTKWRTRTTKLFKEKHFYDENWPTAVAPVTTGELAPDGMPVVELHPSHKDAVLQTYLELYPVVPARLACFVASGESTPYMGKLGVIAQKIRALTPDARLIILLREPAARALSQYLHGCFQRRHSDGLRKAVTPLKGIIEPMWSAATACMESSQVQQAAAADKYDWFLHCGRDRLETLLDRGDADFVFESEMLWTAVFRSVYHLVLAPVFALFPRKNILLVRAEDMFTATTPQLERITAFLGLPWRNWTSIAFHALNSRQHRQDKADRRRAMGIDSESLHDPPDYVEVLSTLRARFRSIDQHLADLLAAHQQPAISWP